MAKEYKMSKLIQGLVRGANLTTTDNGATAFKSTLNLNLDFYGKSGNIGLSETEITKLFINAFEEDQDLAIRNLLNMRDIRGGKGVRDNARKLLPVVANKLNEETIPVFLSKIVEVGRYDDLFSLYNTGNKLHDDLIENLFILRLASDNPSLVAKWTPLNQKDVNSKLFMSRLRSKLGFTPKQMRKFIVEKRNVVETKMCENLWSEINYAHVPSQAMRIYKNAFGRQDETRFEEFLEKVEKGEEKINAGTLYPHEVLGRSHITPDKTAEAQWKALPEYIKEGAKIFPMVDVSASMHCPSYGNYQCMDISIALGLYLAEHNTSIFKNSFLTFHTSPDIIQLKEDWSLAKRKKVVADAPWGGSTDLYAAFELIYDAIDKNDLGQEDLPDYVVVLSDMQFNSSGNKPVSEKVKKKFEKRGLVSPKLIWWNLHASNSNVPVTFDQEGNAFVSGFSPATMTAILECDLEQFTPLNVMLKDLMQDKYNING